MSSTSKAAFNLPEKTTAEKRRAGRLYTALEKTYPDATCALDYSNPHELLIATILSAQSTDVGVNKATPELFRRFPNPSDYAAVSPEELQPWINSIGLYRNKASQFSLAAEHLTKAIYPTVRKARLLPGMTSYAC